MTIVGYNDHVLESNCERRALYVRKDWQQMLEMKQHSQRHGYFSDSGIQVLIFVLFFK